MTEIDDEMVDRALRAFEGVRLYGDRAMRAALEAALSPPKPEIEVTDQMAFAGGDAIHQAGKPNGGIAYTSLKLLATKAYRAMRALEPKAQEGAAYAAPEGRIYRHMTDEFASNQRNGRGRRKDDRV